MFFKKRSAMAVLMAAITMFIFSTVPAYARTISNTINASYTVDKSIFYVSSAEEYNTAYNNAQDGDKIVVLDGKTIEFNSEVTIEKSIILSSETKGGSGINFSTPQARLTLKSDDIDIEGLSFNKDQDGEIIYVTSPKNAVIKDNIFKGNKSNYGISISPPNPVFISEKGIDITGNSFDTFLNGILVKSGKSINVASNKFTNIGQESINGGSIAVDSDINYQLIGSVTIEGNTVDQSTLCYWYNSKLGTQGNITDEAWFDSIINIGNNALGGKVMDAANPLLLTMVSGATINNVTAGSLQDISFKANAVSHHISITGVQFAMKWTTAGGDLTTVSMMYKDSSITKNNDGVYIINAETGIDGTYTLKAGFKRRGTYTLEIYAQVP